MFLCLRVMCCCFWLNLCWPLAIVFDRFPASSPVSAQEFGYGVLTNQSWTKGLIQESSQKVKDGQGFDLGISTPLRKADPSTRPHCCGSAFFLQRPPGHSSDIDLCRAKIFKSDTTAWEAWNCRERLQSKVPAIIYTYIYIIISIMYNHKDMLIQKIMINLLCILFISCLFSPAATWTISMWQPHPLASRTFIRHRGLCLTNAPRGALPGDLGTGFPKTLHEQFARNAEVHCNWSSLSMSKSSLFKGSSGLAIFARLNLLMQSL
jgi:hypothetical protein